jgi:hypothetical protein
MMSWPYLLACLQVFAELINEDGGGRELHTDGRGRASPHGPGRIQNILSVIYAA